MDEFEELRADPLAWIMSNIEDDLGGIECVIDDMDADDILDPALEAYIVPQFTKAGVNIPERSVLIEGINQLIRRITCPQ